MEAHGGFRGLPHPVQDVSTCYEIAVSTDAVSGAPLPESLKKHPVTPHLAHDDPGHQYAPRGAAPARRLRPGARRSRESACEHEPRLRFWLRRRRRLDELVERSNAAVLAQDEDVETHRHDGATAPWQHLPEGLNRPAGGLLVIDVSKYPPFRTTGRTAIEIFLNRRPAGNVIAFLRDPIVAHLAHTFFALSPAPRHKSLRN